MLDGGAPRDIIDAVSFRLEKATLRVDELIAMAVEQQLVRMQGAARATQEEIRTKLNRQYLTEEEIQRLAAGGTVRLPGRGEKKFVKKTTFDLDAEVKRAQRAFEEGTFVIYINGTPAGGLRETLAFPLDSKVVFMRLTPLVGG